MAALLVLPAIEPGQLRNMAYLSAVLVDHAPPSWWVNDVAPRSMLPMCLTFDTPHCERSQLNEVAPLNTATIENTEETSQRETSSL